MSVGGEGNRLEVRGETWDGGSAGPGEFGSDRDIRSNMLGAGQAGEILPKLLSGVEGAALQVELSAVRILFELLGFLLSSGAPVLG